MFKRKNKITNQLLSSIKSSKPVQTCKKEAKSWRKLRNKRHAYTKERIKQREHLNKEIACVNKLRKEGSISKDIHARYLKMLEIGYAQKIQETRDKHGFANPKRAL